MKSDLINAARALAHGPQDTRDENAIRLRSFVLTSEPSAIINEYTSLLGTSDAAVCLILAQTIVSNHQNSLDRICISLSQTYTGIPKRRLHMHTTCTRH